MYRQPGRLAPYPDVCHTQRAISVVIRPPLQLSSSLLETAHRLAADLSVGLYRQAGYARRAALFETLYASGMRISEALSLPSDAAPPGTRMLLVRGKGDKQRLVPLHERAIAAIALWQTLARTHSSGAPSPWLFHSVRNGSKALTRQAALLEIKEAAVTAGLSSPERALHTCCGMPLRPICIQAAPTCACCRSCSVIPASRPPRSTPISTPPVFTRWSETSTHSTRTSRTSARRLTEIEAAVSRLPHGRGSSRCLHTHGRVARLMIAPDPLSESQPGAVSLLAGPTRAVEGAQGRADGRRRNPQALGQSSPGHRAPCPAEGGISPVRQRRL